MKRQAGFTLTEVMLVLVVGAILLGSSLALYNQMRTNSGHTNAWQRVLALQTTVEDLAVVNDGKYPTITELRRSWKIKRASDYTASPWGGTAIAAYETETADGIAGGDRTELDERTPTNIGDSGILYYYRQTTANFNGWLIAPDLAKGGRTTATRFYMVGIADNNGDRYFYLNGAQAVDGETITGGGQ